MSLRVKLLAMFGAFAVVPLLAIGVFDYARSMRALERLIGVQTSLIAERVASEVSDRYDRLQANLTLIAANEETRRLLSARGPSASAIALRTAQPYFDELWSAMSELFVWVTIRDSAGRELYRFGDSRSVPDPLSPATELPDQDSYALTQPIIGRDGQAHGSIAAAVRLSPLLPAEALASRFGRSGYTALIDRASGRVLHGAAHGEALADVIRRPMGSRSPRGAISLTAGGTPVTSVSYVERDSTQLGSMIQMAAPEWTVLSAATVDEFAGTFASIRAANLALVLFATTVAAAAFLLTLWRSTRSLRLLTVAADDVGRGNFEPALPRGGRDEVGRLSAAFGLMIGKVRGMMREIEMSRQMAAVGEFASQISHEIRNPLTSIKLNLQQLERAARAGRMPPDTARPLEITLREIDRLDRVVHGVLRLGGGRAAGHEPVSLLAAVDRAAEVARPQLDRKGIHLAIHHCVTHDQPIVQGNLGMLEGVFLNLLLNAGEASPAGARVQVDIESDARSARVRVRDSGAGVPHDRREHIFQPFFTTKDGGTGLGLALAQRTVEDHGGTIVLDDGSASGDATGGATFLVELPLAGHSRVT